MRAIPGPHVANALPMPAGNSRHWVSHPGSEQPSRFTLAPCTVRSTALKLAGGNNLLDAIAQEIDAEGVAGACVHLDGVPLSDIHYVMPDGPLDRNHAAWYSETYHGQDVRLIHATASVGRRDGGRFLHTHALWAMDDLCMGHLLNDKCIIAKDCHVEAWVISDAWLETALDPETNFPLFRPARAISGEVETGSPCESARHFHEKLNHSSRDFAGQLRGALLTVRPHEDLRRTIEVACSQAGFQNASIHGIGSLIGAGFANALPMNAPLSEVLLLDGCLVREGLCRYLPVACVDPAGAIYQGDLNAGSGPVCVTFEMLIVEEPDCMLQSQPD